MKIFTEPTGKFIVKIPKEWQNKSLNKGVPPFSFELLENPIGAFQLSCYSNEEKQISKNNPIQKFDTTRLQFVNQRMDGNGFNIHLWAAVVEDHTFMAKYIYDTKDQDDPKIKLEIEKVERVLSTIQLISPKNREIAIELDQYENFMTSLAASFDLKNKAVEKSHLLSGWLYVLVRLMRICAWQ